MRAEAFQFPTATSRTNNSAESVNDGVEIETLARLGENATVIGWWILSPPDQKYLDDWKKQKQESWSDQF